LHIAAAGIIDVAQFLLKHGDHIVPVIVIAWIDLAIDCVLELPEMHMRRGWHRDLDAVLRKRLEKLEVVRHDRLLAPDVLRGNRRRRRGADAVIVPERQFRGAKLEAVDGIEKPARPAATTEFAVSDNRKTKPFLHSHRFSYRLVLHLMQLLDGKFACLPIAPGLNQFGWPPQTADMIDRIGRKTD
jgi:hypothetical protein